MRAEDLMIGDWILYDGTPMWVDSIQGDLTLRRRGSSLIKVVFSEDCEPIPLTPEILEKNLFEWNKELEKYQSEWCDLGARCANTWRIGGTCMHISTVHELQHAMRLYRKDWEVEL